MLAFSPVFPTDIVTPKCCTQPAEQSIGPRSLRQTQCIWPHFLLLHRLRIGDLLVQTLVAVGIECQCLLVFCTPEKSP